MKHNRNRNSSNHLQLDKKTVNTWQVCGDRQPCVVSKTFSSGITTGTLETMQKMADFYHNRGSDIMKLAFILPTLAKYYLHKSTTAKCFTFTEKTKDLLEKIRVDMVCWPFTVFTRKTVLDKTFIRDLANWCKTVVGTDASQLFPFSLCQGMPSCLYTRWEMHSETGKIRPLQSKTRSFENLVMSYFQPVRPQFQVERFYMTGTQRKIDADSVDGSCGHCNTVLEAMGQCCHYCSCQEARFSFTEEEIQQGNKKTELGELRKQNIQEKGYNVFEMYESDWWEMYKTDNIVKQRLREFSPIRGFREETLLENIKSGLSLAMFKVILKYPKMSEKPLANVHLASRTLMLAEMTFGRLWNYMPKKKDFWLSQENCDFKLNLGEWNNHYTVAALLSGLGPCLQKKYIALCNTLQWSGSISLFNLRWMLEESETRIQVLVVWQRQRNYYPTVVMVTKFWIGADLQQQRTSVMKKHLELTKTKKIERLGKINDQLNEVEIVKHKLSTRNR